MAHAQRISMSDPKLPARWTDDVRRGTRRGARLPTRAELRELVAEHQMQIREVVAAGANPQQLMLDHRQKLHVYAGHLSKDDAATFLRQYAEESAAASEKPATDARLLQAPVVATPSTTRVLVAVVVVVAVLATVVTLRAFL
jgi:hypothetical protein